VPEYKKGARDNYQKGKLNKMKGDVANEIRASSGRAARAPRLISHSRFSRFMILFKSALTRDPANNPTVFEGYGESREVGVWSAHGVGQG
jgi:hypothetical protein